MLHFIDKALRCYFDELRSMYQLDAGNDDIWEYIGSINRDVNLDRVPELQELRQNYDDQGFIAMLSSSFDLIEQDCFVYQSLAVAQARPVSANLIAISSSKLADNIELIKNCLSDLVSMMERQRKMQVEY